MSNVHLSSNTYEVLQNIFLVNLYSHSIQENISDYVMKTLVRLIHTKDYGSHIDFLPFL